VSPTATRACSPEAHRDAPSCTVVHFSARWCMYISSVNLKITVLSGSYDSKSLHTQDELK
jgi:hypothetical protein